MTIRKPGIYQVDVYVAPRSETTYRPADFIAARRRAGWIMAARWQWRSRAQARLEGDAHFVDSPFGKAVSLDGNGDSLVIPRHDAMNVAKATLRWRPGSTRRNSEERASLVWERITGRTAGTWTCPTTRAACGSKQPGRTIDPTGRSLRRRESFAPNAWQHVAAVVRRGKNETRLYVNGYPVAKGEIGPANLDNPKMNLHLGRIAEAQAFRGELDEVRIYRRALGEAEIQALVQPGRQFAHRLPKNLKT